MRKNNHNPLQTLVYTSLMVLSIAGCGKDPNADLPPAASRLVEPSKSESSSTLPHTVDTVTEFQTAIESLAPGQEKPEVRETDSGVVTVVRVEKTKGIKQTGITSSSVQQSLPTPKAIEQDWSGVVLLPDRTRMSKAYTTDVDLERIEAHPLLDDSLRVWVRVANLAGRPLNARIACNFSDSDKVSGKTDFVPISIPAGGSIDAYFMSPMTEVTSYTILVR